MSARILRAGEQSQVHCPCGWKGVRARSTTQPCPSCCRPIEWLPVQAQRRVYQRRHDQRREDERVAEVARLREHLARERANEAAELERIDAQLRVAREEASR